MSFSFVPYKLCPLCGSYHQITHAYKGVPLLICDKAHEDTITFYPDGVSMQKKNKPDLTTRNLKAAKKREATLKERVKALEVLVRAHERDISWILSHLQRDGR